SNLRYGMAQADAPARRAAASQTDDGGADLSAGQGGTLPRTQAAMGLPLPAAAQISDNLYPSGTGGAAAQPGGMTSRLNVGQDISVQRVAANGTPRGNSRGETYAGVGTGDATVGGVPGGNGPGAVIGPGGPRRVDVGTTDGDDHGLGGIPRARGEAFSPRATVEPGESVGGPAAVAQGPNKGVGPQGYRGPTVGPDESLGGTGRLYGPGQRI